MEKVLVGSWDRLQGGNIGGHEPLTMEVWQSRGVLSGACSISLAAPSRRASRGKRLRWLRAGSSSCDAGRMKSVSASRRESRVHVASAVGKVSRPRSRGLADARSNGKGTSCSPARCPHPIGALRIANEGLTVGIRRSTTMCTRQRPRLARCPLEGAPTQPLLNSSQQHGRSVSVAEPEDLVYVEHRFYSLGGVMINSLLHSNCRRLHLIWSRID